MPFLSSEKILREYIRATALGMPDARAGSGIGSTRTVPGGVGATYQKQGTYPYREPDILDDENSDKESDEEAELSTASPSGSKKKLSNKINLTHRSPDRYKRRDLGSFSGHSVRYDLHQGLERVGKTMTEKPMNSTGRSITPIPGLYANRTASGAMGGVSPSGTTSGPAPKGGVVSNRSWNASQKLTRDEKKPRKYTLFDILYGEDPDDEDEIFTHDEEV